MFSEKQMEKNPHSLKAGTDYFIPCHVLGAGNTAPNKTNQVFQGDSRGMAAAGIEM